MPKQQDLRTLVEQFVSDLSARVREAALETLRAALGKSPAPERRGPGRPRKSGKSRGPGRPPKAAARPRKARGRIRRSAADLEQTAVKIRAYVRSNAGQRIEEIGRGLKTATERLKRPIQALIAAGSLRTEGQKRGTRYFAGGRRKAKAARKASQAKGRRAKRKARKTSRRSSPKTRAVTLRSEPRRKVIRAQATGAVREIVPTQMEAVVTRSA
jgi:hypothetical protein